MDKCSTFCRNHCGGAGHDGNVVEDGGKNNNDNVEMTDTENHATRQGNDHQAKLTKKDTIPHRGSTEEVTNTTEDGTCNNDDNIRNNKRDNVKGDLPHSSKNFQRNHSQEITEKDQGTSAFLNMTGDENSLLQKDGNQKRVENDKLDVASEITEGNTLTMKELAKKMQAHQIAEEYDCSGENAMQETETCYKCVDMPGKGMGMIATRDIKFGELILSELPVLIDSFDLKFQFEELAKDQQTEILSLHNCYPERMRMGLLGELIGIMSSNCFFGKSAQQNFLCPTASRFNHSCLPNVRHNFSEQYLRIYALRDIKSGIELCTTYSHFDGTIKEIREELKEKWRFDCECTLCNMKDHEKRQEVETNRLKYWAMYDKLEMPSNLNLNHIERLAEVNLIFEVMEKGEMLEQGLKSMHSFEGFRSALVCKQRLKAHYYIEQAYQANLIAEGEFSPKTRQYLDLMNNPQDDPYFTGWSDD